MLKATALPSMLEKWRGGFDLVMYVLAIICCCMCLVRCVAMVVVYVRFSTRTYARIVHVVDGKSSRATNRGRDQIEFRVVSLSFYSHYSYSFRMYVFLLLFSSHDIFRVATEDGKLISSAGSRATNAEGKLVGNEAIAAILSNMWNNFERCPDPTKTSKDERVCLCLRVCFDVCVESQRFGKSFLLVSLLLLRSMPPLFLSLQRSALSTKVSESDDSNSATSMLLEMDTGTVIVSSVGAGFLVFCHMFRASIFPLIEAKAQHGALSEALRGVFSELALYE